MRSVHTCSACRQPVSQLCGDGLTKLSFWRSLREVQILLPNLKNTIILYIYNLNLQSESFNYVILDLVIR